MTRKDHQQTAQILGRALGIMRTCSNVAECVHVLEQANLDFAIWFKDGTANFDRNKFKVAILREASKVEV